MHKTSPFRRIPLEEGLVRREFLASSPHCHEQIRTAIESGCPGVRSSSLCRHPYLGRHPQQEPGVTFSEFCLQTSRARFILGLFRIHALLQCGLPRRRIPQFLQV